MALINNQGHNYEVRLDKEIGSLTHGRIRTDIFSNSSPLLEVDKLKLFYVLAAVEVEGRYGNEWLQHIKNHIARKNDVNS